MRVLQNIPNMESPVMRSAVRSAIRSYILQEALEPCSIRPNFQIKTCAAYGTIGKLQVQRM